MTPYFIQAFIYLCAAVIAVPIAKRLGLGSVLGYLMAGIIIGPVFGLVGQETVTIQHFAEFGVVMMLFLVGLELEPKALWGMRHRLIGLGGLQVGLTALIVTGLGLVFQIHWSIAITIGLIFSLSSTAIVLQTFSEKGLTKTEGGQAAFSVLLFQDIAVIPMLAIIPILALPELVEQSKTLLQSAAEHHENLSLVAGLPGWAHTLVVIVAVASVVAGGHFLMRPLFRFVASSGLREIFTTTTLMLIIGIAALMSLVGLSPALGTFLAGVVLATSEFKHELESDLEPFKGLLLGLFFITVGAGINFAVLTQDLWLILGLTLGVIFIKAAVLYLLARIFRVHNSDRWLLTLSLAQAGEFGFVLLSYSTQHHVLPNDIAQILSLVVALSMLLTPALFIFFDKVILPKFEDAGNNREADEIDEQGPVIIAGMGRFGQIINRLLVANGFKTVALDHEVTQVENMRKIHVKGYFGDATRPDLLHTAGIEKATLVVVAMDDRARSTELVAYLSHKHPHVSILARAFDRGHRYELRSAGANFIVSETYYSALEMGREALVQLGFHPFKAEQTKSEFSETEIRHDQALYKFWKEHEEENKFSSHYRALFLQLEAVLGDAMKKDRLDSHSKSERGWTPPPKGYTEDIEDSTS